ncbi:uncharacterized protein [Misgurnus anguillicaudatus]|uniref:uncharacterized protein isoform X1 n=1 Tax=Misgurnus anguillicaudatus TaxID=75329 RepID=UPI003CCF251E
MASIRPYYWIILLLSIILMSLIIIIIFIIINVCIKKRAAGYQTQTKPNPYNDTKPKNQESNVYHKNFESEKPPLPPRDQFLSTESVDEGYEHVEPLPDYLMVEGSTPFMHQKPCALQYATVETENFDRVSVSEDYDDVEIPASTDSEDYDDVVC